MNDDRELTPYDRNVQDYWTIEAMAKFGGSFVKALAEAARHADPANLRKIKGAFELYWAQYVRIGQRMEAEREGRISDKLAEKPPIPGMLNEKDH